MGYIATYESGLQIVSVRDPKQPEIIGSVDTPGDANSVAVSGETAYIADGDGGLQIVSVRDPEHPEIIGSVDTPGDANGVAVSGAKLHI